MPETIAYTVRRSDRARRVRITVDPAKGVVVVLPRRAAEREAARAVAELRPWIERRLEELRVTRSRVAEREGRVPYLGRLLSVTEEEGRTRVHRTGEMLLTPAGETRVPALERWYRRQAREVMLPRLEHAAAAVERPFSAMTIRGQRTRWGSCTARGAISLNWRLLLAPEPVLDYVVWHEACHLAQMNHSPRFWELVARHCPDHAEHSRWLRRHGGELALS